MSLEAVIRPINLLFSANRAYAPYLSAALTSVRHNLGRDASLHVTVLTRDLPPHEVGWPNRRSGDELRCLPPDIPAQTSLPIRGTDHVSVETYYRLFLDSVFDPSVTRVVYLDADLVVLGDLSRLNDLDLQGKTVAAALDIHVREWANVPYLATVGPAGAPYFNAGVLVIDLAAWRARGVGRRALAFLAEARDRVSYWDQDALNHALRDDWLELDPRWNRTSHYWEQLTAGSLPFPTEIASQLAHPYVVHFASGRKPWQEYRHPDRRVFDRYVTLAGFPSARMTFRKALARKIRRLWATRFGRA